MGRGLSQLQIDIMRVTREKGYITPAAAAAEAWANLSEAAYKNMLACAAASASRALRRLVQRGLLVRVQRALYEGLRGNPVRPRYRGQSDLYRLSGWHGPLPWILNGQRTHEERLAPPEGAVEQLLEACKAIG